jgi:hypothetical protein
MTGLVRPRARGVAGYRESVSACLHVLMSVAVIAMFWPWGDLLPTIAQVTVFTAAAAWFAGQALFGGDALCRVRCANWYHAATMATVVWIAVLMSVPTAAVAVAGSGSMPADMGGMDMSGMDMSGMDMSGQAPPALGTGIASAPGTAVGWAGPLTLVLAAGFFAIAAWYAFAALRPLASPGPRQPPGALSRDTISALIAAGMAAALLEMA